MNKLKFITIVYYCVMFILGPELVGLVCSAQDVKASRDSRFYSYLGLSGLVRGGTVEPHWTGEGDTFWYVDHGPSGKVVVRVDPEKKTRQSIVEGSSIRKALAAQLGHESCRDCTAMMSCQSLDGFGIAINRQTRSDPDELYPARP